MCWIELCSSVTSSAPCGAGMDLTAGVCFRLPYRHPRRPLLDVRVERVGVGGFRQVVPHNLRRNLMALVRRSSESFSNGESRSCMVVVARLAAVQPVVRPEVMLAQPSCNERR